MSIRSVSVARCSILFAAVGSALGSDSSIRVGAN